MVQKVTRYLSDDGQLYEEEDLAKIADLRFHIVTWLLKAAKTDVTLSSDRRSAVLESAEDVAEMLTRMNSPFYISYAAPSNTEN